LNNQRINPLLAFALELVLIEEILQIEEKDCADKHVT
jgi:hypothetical protein